MNEELDGLVSLGIERGRDFNYISKVLGEEGFSAAEIKAAEALYNQKKKIPSGPYVRIETKGGFWGIGIGWSSRWKIRIGAFYASP